MSTTENCSWCLYPLNGNSFFEKLVPATVKLDCEHQLHQGCLINLTDQIHRTDPTAKTHNCPLCRQATVIKTKHSAEQIVEWEETTKTIIIAAGTVLGAAIGLALGTIGRRRSPLIERVANELQKRGSPLMGFIITMSLLSCFISRRLVQPGATSNTWVTKVVTYFYNRFRETAITTNEVFLHRSGLLKQDPEIQMYIILNVFFEVGLRTMKNWIEQVQFFSPEEKASLKPLEIMLNSWVNDRILTSKLFASFLKTNHGDVYAKALKVGVNLLEGIGNEELKEELGEIANTYLITILTTKANGKFTLADPSIAARICLVSTLESFKEKIPFDDVNNGKKWEAFLTSLQEECRNVESTLVPVVLQKLGEDFFKRPLTQLLFNRDIEDDIFVNIFEVRKAEFEIRGLSIER